MDRGNPTPPGAFRVATRFLASLFFVSIATSLFALSIPELVAAQIPMLDGTTDSPHDEGPHKHETSGDPLLAIENALANARQRQSALERARAAVGEGETAQPSVALELAARLVRVLEERREVQVRTNDLNLGRAAIESILARDPSELFGVPPPFPVPILDGVLQSWRREAEQESDHRRVLEDRRANLRLAGEIATKLDKDRRRLRDVLEGEDDEVERIRLQSEIRGLRDRLLIANEQTALARQRVESATIKHDIKGIATRQARAALTWVEAHLAPRETDLAEAIERLDRNRFDIDREIDLARSRLVSSEGTLQATEERSHRIDEGDRVDFDSEVAARRKQLSHRQRIVALLNQRIERLGRMRTTWQHRYAVLSDRLEIEEAPGWLESAENELDRHTRLRRIHETELAQLRLELATLIREIAESAGETESATRWLKVGLEDLERLVALYQVDLATLDTAIQLEERLRAELSARIENRDLTERIRSYAESFRSFWSLELTTSEDRAITPGKILIALTVFVIGYIIARFMMPLLSRRFFPRLGFDAGASNAFASLSFYAFLAVAFLFALRAVNIPLTAFAVVGGALALGIGFGSQAVIANFISGLLLLAERPIRIGDLIEVGGVVGTVESIGLRSTRIRTADNFHIIVPNASFLETNVINWTHQDPRMRLRISVGVAYGSSTRDVERLLVEAAASHPRSLEGPTPKAYFMDFGDSALIFQIRFWIRYDDRTDRSAILSDIRFLIDERFAENGIVIAFPQIDVHLDDARSTP